MKKTDWILNKLDRLNQFLKLHPEIVIFIIVTLFVAVGFGFQKQTNDSFALKIEKDFTNADLTISERLKTSGRLDSINLCKNLKTVYYYIDNLKKAKFELAKRYQGFVISCYSLGIFLVGLAAIAGFIITKVGWDNSRRARKALFLSFSFYGIVLGTFPKLFNQEVNYKTNFNDYTALSQAQLYIYRKISPYISQQSLKLNKLDSIELNNAADTVNRIISFHSNVYLDFDANQLENIKKFELNSK